MYGRTVLAFVLVLFSLSLIANGVDVGADSGWALTLEASAWHSSGDAGFVLADEIGKLSELEFPLDGSMGELRADIRRHFPCRGMALGIGARGSFATSLDVSGTSKDRDFDDWGFQFNYSESDSEADIDLWSADVLVLAQPFLSARYAFLRTAEFGLIVGYGERSYAFDDSNIDLEYEYGTYIETYEGPVATYDVDFTGPRFGVMASCRPVERLLLSGEMILIPQLEAESDAYWVLRDYPFQQEAEGSGSIVIVRAAFQVTEHVDLFASFRTVSLTADEDGVESGVFEGVEIYENEPIVDEITSEYTGGEIGVAVTF